MIRSFSAIHPFARLLLSAAAVAAGSIAAGPRPPALPEAAGPQAPDTTCLPYMNATLCGRKATVALQGGAIAPVRVFQGVRYAAKPGRWQATEPVPAPAERIVQATAPGTVCAQIAPAGTERDGLHADFTAAGGGAYTVVGGEDCLFANVFIPAGTPASPRPVMVFIHGGAFAMGAGSSPLYDGSYLAASGNVVVVTINYRLGSLGFLATDSIAGNFGLWDQQQALKWVQQNIGAFGGDPARVTIFGESAGAMSAGLHLFSVPSSASLFRAAIMQSNPMGYRYRSADSARIEGASFRRTLCGSKRCSVGWMRDTATLAQIMDAQNGFIGGGFLKTRAEGLSAALTWAPYVDGTLVERQPYRGYAPSAPPKPFIIGVNRDEGVVFSGMAHARDRYEVNSDSYGEMLASIFGASGKQQITSAAGGKYRADGHPPVAGLGPAESALALLINDFAFDCGSLAAADAGTAVSTTNAPVYGYLFARDTLFFNLYKNDSGVCNPTNRMVCHGFELPYVFNTLGAVATNSVAGGQPLRADSILARNMAAAWTAFATDPIAGPGRSWTAYTARSGKLYTWGGRNSGSTQNVATAANCLDPWSKVPPLNGARSAAAQTAPRPVALRP